MVARISFSLVSSVEGSKSSTVQAVGSGSFSVVFKTGLHAVKTKSRDDYELEPPF